MIAAALLFLTKRVLLNPWVWLVVLICAAFMGTYQYGFTQGEVAGDRAATAEYEPEIANLTKTLAKAQQDLEVAYSTIEQSRQRIKDLAALHDQAMDQQKLDDAKVLAVAKKKLAVAQVKLNQYAKVLKDALPKMVSAQADSRCTIPVGFVRLHDAFASGSNPGPTAEAAGVPPGGPSDADAPSTIKLSDVARVTAGNYAQCNYRGEVIRQWQDWYRGSFAAYERATATQQGPADLVH